MHGEGPDLGPLVHATCERLPVIVSERSSRETPRGREALVFRHIRERVHANEDKFLINPYGMFFDEITASSLVKIDIHGNKVQDSPYPVNFFFKQKTAYEI